MRFSLLCCFVSLTFLLSPCFAEEQGVDLLNRVVDQNGRVYAKAVTGTTQKGASKGNYLVEPVKDKDGNVIKLNVWAEDILVDEMAPDSFDRNKKMRTYRGKDGEVGVAIYGDKQLNRLRANGFILEAPLDSNLVKVVRDGDNSRIVWQDKQGNYLTALVPRLPNRPNIPQGSNKNVKTEPVDAELAQQLDLPAPQDNPSAANDTNKDGVDGNNVVADKDPNNTDEPLPDDLGIGAGGDNGQQDKNTNQSNQVVIDGPGPPDYGVEAIKEPGNPYGVDNILSADEVKAAANAAMGEVRGKAKDGLTLNEYGVGVGGKAGLQHAGGIDGCIDATHALIKYYPNVASHVKKIASEKRAKLEKERSDKIAQAANAYQERLNQANNGGSYNPGPVATSNDRQGGGSKIDAPPEPPKAPEMPEPPKAPSGEDIGISSSSSSRPGDDELE